jgi:hypothetical protein
MIILALIVVAVLVLAVLAVADAMHSGGRPPEKPLTRR